MDDSREFEGYLIELQRVFKVSSEFSRVIKENVECASRKFQKQYFNVFPSRRRALFFISELRYKFLSGNLFIMLIFRFHDI